jgi:hypothetical protein
MRAYVAVSLDVNSGVKTRMPLEATEGVPTPTDELLVNAGEKTAA